MESENNVYSITKHESSVFYNSLSILLKALLGVRTTVDLRNESWICGIVDHVDGFMNVVMKECTFMDPRGDTYKLDMFFVQSRNIRYVHIPPQIRIVPSIQNELLKMKHKPISTPVRTFKSKRANERQKEGLAAVNKILQEKENKEDEK